MNLAKANKNKEEKRNEEDSSISFINLACFRLVGSM
jgi:hypothetical protein